MDEKISLEAISLYSNAYAEKMLKAFFNSRQKISGREILSLCNIQQINLFVLGELFKSWRDETHKLKSPYFDYEHTEVKDALENFMRVLSQNISIDQEHFLPLLKKAVGHTLLSVFDPYDFYSMLILGKNNRLEVASFREEIKYLKINKAPLERLLQRLEEKQINDISGNEAFGLLDQILEEVNFTPEDVDDYIEKFSIVIPLDPETLYTKKTQPQVTQAPIQQVAKAPAPPRTNQPKDTSLQSNQSTTTTLNDKLNKTQRPAVIDKLQRITRIKDSLTINQKFMFTKVLFHGDFELFSKAINDIDRQDTIKGAMRYLEENYGDWDQESEEFHEFMELVEKRFS
jgi:hypothetical protein